MSPKPLEPGSDSLGAFNVPGPDSLSLMSGPGQAPLLQVFRLEGWGCDHLQREGSRYKLFRRPIVLVLVQHDLGLKRNGRIRAGHRDRCTGGLESRRSEERRVGEWSE